MAVPIREANVRNARRLEPDDGPVESDQVALTETVAELVGRQLRLERCRHESRRLARVAVGANADLMLQVAGEPVPEQRQRNEADEGEGR